jgi:hypothetical protein
MRKKVNKTEWYDVRFLLCIEDKNEFQNTYKYFWPRSYKEMKKKYGEKSLVMGLFMPNYDGKKHLIIVGKDDQNKFESETLGHEVCHFISTRDKEFKI